MSERERRQPKHGDIVTDSIPARVRRRRWCATCHVWTRETPTGSNIWTHGRGCRTEACRMEARG